MVKEESVLQGKGQVFFFDLGMLSFLPPGDNCAHQDALGPEVSCLPPTPTAVESPTPRSGRPHLHCKVFGQGLGIL